MLTLFSHLVQTEAIDLEVSGKTFSIYPGRQITIKKFYRNDKTRELKLFITSCTFKVFMY